jgi:hypothetical protein
MSHIRWPEGVEFELITLEPEAEARVCTHCERFTYVSDHKDRHVHSLRAPLRVVSKVACCPDKGCAGHAEKQRPTAQEMSIAPPLWSVSWDVFAWMGHRRFARHWSVPQIRTELKDRFRIEVSADLVESYVGKYEVMVAARESDVERLVEEYRDVPDVMPTIDGLQPEKGHETLYVVRELRLQRVWFAEPLLSSGAPEVRRLFERTRDIAARIGKPVRSWMSDKQQAFVSGVEEVFPGVPHRYCANHFLRDAAKPVLEKDSHAKVQMRRKVRGLREIEKEMLARAGVAEASRPAAGPTTVAIEYVEQADAPPTTVAVEQVEQTAGLTTVAIEHVEQVADPTTVAVEPLPDGASEQQQVVLDYCATVRGILNDDQGGPLKPPAIRMDAALGEVQDSIERLIGAKKGGPARRMPRATAARRPYAS